MKRLFPVLFFIFSLPLYAQTNSGSLLQWSKNAKLTWNDFQGVPPKTVGKESARSFIEIRTRGVWKHHLPRFRVLVWFKKSDSWARDTSRALLDHEQLHFDIGELYGRKIKKAFSKFSRQGDTVMKDYSRVVTTYYGACENDNTLYDSETAHGINPRQQQEWEVKVAKELNRLRKYRTP